MVSSYFSFEASSSHPRICRETKRMVVKFSCSSSREMSALLVSGRKQELRRKGLLSRKMSPVLDLNSICMELARTLAQSAVSLLFDSFLILLNPTPHNCWTVCEGSTLRYCTHSEPDFSSLVAVQTIDLRFLDPCWWASLIEAGWVILLGATFTADASAERGDRRALWGSSAAQRYQLPSFTMVGNKSLARYQRTTIGVWWGLSCPPWGFARLVEIRNLAGFTLLDVVRGKTSHSGLRSHFQIMELFCGSWPAIGLLGF